jgi:hypothetical protein
MMKKILLILFFILIVLGGVWFYFTPYISFHNMRLAAENRDAVTLSDYIDYPSLKESLKVNLHAMMSGKSQGKKDTDPFDKMGEAIATAFINPVIDAFVTPENLSMMMRGYIPPLNKSERTSEKKTENGTRKKTSHDDSDIETSMYYESFNRFVVKVKNKGSAENPVELIFRRDGVIYWKLSAIKLS